MKRKILIASALLLPALSFGGEVVLASNKPFKAINADNGVVCPQAQSSCPETKASCPDSNTPGTYKVSFSLGSCPSACNAK